MQRLFLGLAVVFLGCLAIPANLNAEDAEDYFNRGRAWAKRASTKRPSPITSEAIRLLDPNNPKDATKLAAVYNNRGNACEPQGRNTTKPSLTTTKPSARSQLPSHTTTAASPGTKKASTTRPSLTTTKPCGFDPKSTFMPSLQQSRHRLGEKGEYDKAIADYNQALRAQSQIRQSLQSIAATPGTKRANTTRPSPTTTKPWRSIPITPTPTQSRHRLEKKGEYDKAIADYNQAMAIDPNDAHAYNDLAWLHATCPDEKYRDGKKAVENASKAYQLDGGKKWGLP